jgi:phosphoribosylformimino-5-aminoimidazole carboxamide ribotide isomerase
MKLIAAIDIMQGSVVRLLKGNPNEKVVYSRDPLSTAFRWLGEGADMLHIVDLDATLSDSNNRGIIKDICSRLRGMIRIQVAGGLRSIDTISEMIEYADVVIGTIAYKREDLLKYLLDTYGNDRVVVAVDHSGGRVVIDGWRSSTGIPVIDAMRHIISLGAKRFLLTSVDRDGTMQGIDVDTVRSISSIDAEVIVSGGVASIEDIKVLESMDVYAVILGKALYEGKINIKDIRRVLN